MFGEADLHDDNDREGKKRADGRNFCAFYQKEGQWTMKWYENQSDAYLESDGVVFGGDTMEEIEASLADNSYGIIVQNNKHASGHVIIYVPTHKSLRDVMTSALVQYGRSRICTVWGGDRGYYNSNGKDNCDSYHGLLAVHGEPNLFASNDTILGPDEQSGCMVLRYYLRIDGIEYGKYGVLEEDIVWHSERGYLHIGIISDEATRKKRLSSIKAKVSASLREKNGPTPEARKREEAKMNLDAIIYASSGYHLKKVSPEYLNTEGLDKLLAEGLVKLSASQYLAILKNWMTWALAQSPIASLVNDVTWYGGGNDGPYPQYFNRMNLDDAAGLVKRVLFVANNIATAKQVKSLKGYLKYFEAVKPDKKNAEALKVLAELTVETITKKGKGKGK